MRHPIRSAPRPGWDAFGQLERATQCRIGVVADLEGDVEKTALWVAHEQLRAVHAPVRHELRGVSPVADRNAAEKADRDIPASLAISATVHGCPRFARTARM